MTDLMITATFTKNVGQPALGLTLAEIDLWLTAIHRSTGAVSVIWDGTQHPDIAGTNVGVYGLIYSATDLDTYNYFASAHYTGVIVLDQDWLNGGLGIDYIPLGTAQEHEYRVWAGSPQVVQEGVDVYFYDSTNTILKWNGSTDMNGYAIDIFGNWPRLDPGTYKVRRYKGGIIFDNPDTEVVT